jgi:hypothetical protein
MIYRKAELEDIPELKRLCNVHGLNLSPTALILIAYDEQKDKIVGMVGVEQVAFIQPLVSENMVAANNLFRMAEGIFLANNIQYSRVICDKKLERLYNKAGFTKVFDNSIIMEKKYYGRK